MSSKKVFLSYSRADSKFALKIVKKLGKLGVEVWIDQSEIQAGKQWDQSIEEALIKSDVVLAIISPSSIKSKIVMDEISCALDEGKLVVPILYKSCKIPLLLKRIQWIDFHSGFEFGYKKLLETLTIQKVLKVNEKTKNANQRVYEPPMKIPRIEPDSSDEVAFLYIMEKIIEAAISKNSPENVFLTRIDNWFDHKWLKFSGIERKITNNIPESEINYVIPESEINYVEIRHDRVTVPPFNPNRVMYSHYFQRDSKGLFFKKELVLHRKIESRSAKVIHRRILDIAESALFFWFSSNSAKNQRGAVMVYEVNEKVLTWYCSFGTTIKSNSWKIETTKGITKIEVESFIGD